MAMNSRSMRLSKLQCAALIALGVPAILFLGKLLLLILVAKVFHVHC